MEIAAFFDVDDTIVKGRTMIDYHIYYNLNKPEKLLKNKKRPHFIKLFFKLFFIFQGLLQLIRYTALNRNSRNRKFYEGFKGREVNAYKSLIPLWFNSRIRHKIYSEAIKLIKWHQEQGHKVVLITGSLDLLVEPLQKFLNADYTIATRLETKNGKFSGKIIDSQIIGEGKALAIKRFANEHNINLKESYGYADHISDLPMLGIVGKPVVVGSNRKLQIIAKQKGWKIIKFKILESKRCP